MLKNEVHKRRL